MRTRTSGLLAAVALGATAACGGGSDRASAPSATMAATVADTEPAATTAPDETAASPSADGVLRIGILLPQTGPGNEIGIPGIAAADAAILAINEDGGVLGQPVTRAIADEGDTPQEARAGISQLLSQDVDAIVGPASSTVAMATLDELIDAGVLVCSPTASAMALNDYPNRDLFFRTIPSDSLMAQGMAQQTIQLGVSGDVTVAYLDDAYGRPLARVAADRLGSEPDIGDVRELPFPSDDEDFSDEALQLAENPSDAVLIIADNARGWAFVSELAETFATEPPYIIVSEVMRHPQPEVVMALPPEVRARIYGVGQALWDRSANEPPGAYATNSFDCVNLIALAAFAAGRDDPREMATWITPVSVGGAQCLSFSECRELLELSRNINYQGPSGFLDIGERGDPARGRVQAFVFNDQGLDVPAPQGGPMTLTDIES